MSTLTAPILGFAIGFLAAIPIGPLNVAVMTEALRGRDRPPYALVLGGSIPDFAYASTILLGFAGILTRFFEIDAVRIGFGGAVAAYGTHVAWRGAAPLEDDDVGTRRAARAGGAFWVGFLISAFNPGLVLSWVVLAGALHGAGVVGTGTVENLAFAAGAWGGMVSWLGLLLYSVARFRSRVPLRGLRILIRGFGLVLIGLAILCVSSAFVG